MTTIAVTKGQKSKLIRFKTRLEGASGEEVSQGEAVEHAAELAIEHLDECGGRDR